MGKQQGPAVEHREKIEYPVINHMENNMRKNIYA